MPAWLILAALLTIPVTLAQDSKIAPTFDVASIKQVEMPERFVGQVGLRIDAAHGTFGCDYCNLQFLIEWAYDLKSYQVSSPRWPWLRSNLYRIDARMPTGATNAQLQVMMQQLLAERFKLKGSLGQKELPVFALTAGPKGPKLKPSTRPATLSSGTLYLTSHNTSLGGLANSLSKRLSRPVLDQTGIEGRYDIDLSWNQADSVELDLEIQRAVRDQLGLALRPSTAKMTVLVIESMEKAPTAN